MSSARCRACLRESSDSAHLGDFRIAAAQVDVLHTIYLMSTSREASDVFNSCIASHACSGTTVQIQGRRCAPLLLNPPMQDTSYKEEGALYSHETRKERGIQVLSIREQFRSVTLKNYCLSKHKPNPRELTTILKEIAKSTNGIVVMLHHGTDSNTENSKIHYMHVLAQRFDPQDTEDGYVKIGLVHFLKIENDAVCTDRNALQFDTLPIKDQVSVSMSEEKRTMQKNIVIDYSTECVWASFIDRIRCNKCIKSRSGATLMTNTDLSESTSLSYFTSNFNKRKLSSCINSAIKSTTRCFHLVYVPNFMCGYEYERYEQDIGLQQSHKFFAGTYPVMDESQEGLVASNAFSARPSSLQLSGVHIVLESNVMLVFYDIPGRNCLKYLALKHDILMVSVEKNYIWMLYEPEIIFDTEECEGISLTIRRGLHHNVDSVQSVSAINVDKLFSVHFEKGASSSKANDILQQNSQKKRRKLYSDRDDDDVDAESEEISLSRSKNSDTMKRKKFMYQRQKIDSPIVNSGHNENDAIDTNLEYAKQQN